MDCGAFVVSHTARFIGIMCYIVVFLNFFFNTLHCLRLHAIFVHGIT